MAAKPKDECFRCADLTKQEHAALKAVHVGEANAHQQRLTLKVIISIFSRAHDILYIPDSFDQSAFMNGRAFVGQKILKYLNIPVGTLDDDEKEIGGDKK